MANIKEDIIKKINNIDIDKEAELRSMIEQRVEPVLEKITDKDKKEAAEEFWYDNFQTYISTLAKIDYLIIEEELTPEEAYEDVRYSSDKIVEEGDRLEEILGNKKIINEIKNAFRDLSGRWVYKSEIVKHAYEKPFGYAGDYQIIENIYSNKIKSLEIGYCYDKYFLNNNYSIAVRARKEKMKEILYNYFTEVHSHINILNIGSGSSREIRELFHENTFNYLRNVFISLVDHDVNSLLSSKEVLQYCPENVEYNFIRSNILEFIKYPKKYHKLLTNKDIIYSIGLVDYLPERVVKQLLLFLFNLLNPGGKLIIAHKNSKKYKALAADWWCEWKFYNRDENMLINIINNCGINNYSIKKMDSLVETIFFIEIEKQ